jgi:small subunit ribosomal protein S10e
VSNIEVLALCKSLSSRKFVKETFNWRWFYYSLTPEGIEHLREYLGLPEDVVPATVKRAQKNPISAERSGDKGKNMEPRGFKASFEGGGNRDGYRAAQKGE